MIKYPIYVTVDTNVLDAANFDFNEKSTLQLLVNYVKNGKVKVVLSNIVVKEAEKHIAQRGVDVYSLMRKLRSDALKKATDYQIKQLGLGQILDLSADKAEIRQKSIDLLHKYIAELGAEILDTREIDLNAIIDDYFEIRAPFQNGEKKRKEFPDAFIANQIRERFGHEEMVAIISDDKGFKEACQPWDNHLFFSSLGDLYGELNTQEKFYAATKDFVMAKKSDIESHLAQFIKNDVEINVIGLSHDRKGVIQGYDYTETYLNSLTDITVGIHSVDEINDKKSIVTLKCKGSFTMDCFYPDYDNAPWDSEEKEYIYVDTVGIREVHKANFACRIEINRAENIFEILPFEIILGEDSRKERHKIEADLEHEYDYEQEIADMEIEKR
jgi:predicted Fe-Mo cluster-binding NifX family protein